MQRAFNLFTESCLCCVCVCMRRACARASRVIEDYAVVYFGSALFKIGRLLVIATFSVHIFACVYFRVKIAYAYSPDDVTNFYTSKNIDPNVSA